MRGFVNRLAAAGRPLRNDRGSVWPLAFVILFGATLLIGIVIRVGSATLLKDEAQTAADAAALAMASSGSSAEASRVAALNDATLVEAPTRQGADAWVVEVETAGSVFGRASIKGRAKAAASKVAATAPVSDAGDASPPPPELAATYGPCGVSGADWRGFIGGFSGGRATGADLARLPGFLRDHGFTTAGGGDAVELRCSATQGEDSLSSVGSRLVSYGFAVRYVDQFPTTVIALSVPPRDGSAPTAPLIGAGQARLVPLTESTGGDSQ